MDGSLDEFVRCSNLANFAKQLVGLPVGPKREMLMRLLAEENAKAPMPAKSL